MLAKDGTQRGGRRVRAGDKPNALYEKLEAGQTAEIIDMDEMSDEMPAPSKYLYAKQWNGERLCAEDIYKETWQWLKQCGCHKLINQRLLESYAATFARYIQCEEHISKHGLIGKHPTTGADMTSPYVSMRQSFLKQSNLLWYEIFEIVKANCKTKPAGDPHEDQMERILNGR